jgi:hypothetical protein
MSDSIENLLVRNPHEVFAERDPARRATAIEAIFDRDCLFSEIRAASMSDIGPWTMRLSPSRHNSRTTFFRRSAALTPCRIVGDSPGHSARRTNRAGITGLDVAVVNAGRISAVYTFLGPTAA